MKNKEGKWNKHESPGELVPPKWPLKLLRSFVKKEYLEEIEGDMEEVFRDNLSMYSGKRAGQKYFWEVLNLLRPALIENVKGTYQLNQYGMLKTILKL